MGKFFAALVKWILAHPEVIESVATAVTSHQKKATPAE